jgi:hypothetical protein
VTCVRERALFAKFSIRYGVCGGESRQSELSQGHVFHVMSKKYSKTLHLLSKSSNGCFVHI